ncbi:GNAT family N-acetyltransferase [Aureimonas leprariae]|uniref:GNAT family N-acetyltransferase n=1 Tax=Plantimonas leprariae TaxID=2615207 RepID=A0A7V7PKF7_9HYPH|nr:GNAT family N-acetyltransferase [Aureimonas leprariae]KAB0676300.1 GNAT family N-acetyltransferase [Aureimonas leprariae]
MEMLTSSRLRFDAWQAADLPLLHALHSDPAVQAGYAAASESWTLAAIAARLRAHMLEQEAHGHTKWKLSLRDGTFVGRAGWSPWENQLEIGYAIQPAFQRRGIAQEAAAALIEWAVRHHADKRLVGFALVRNTASRRVLEAVGMRFVDERMIAGALNAYFQYDRRPEAS